MFSTAVGLRHVPIDRVVADAVDYFRHCLQPDGSIADDPASAMFREWDTVNALKAIALWQDIIHLEVVDIVEPALKFLAKQEKPSGMLSWGGAEIASDRYCTETSSEYVTALTLLGRTDEARVKALFLRERQRTDGAWEETHSHIPRAFQLESSVTGFALLALDGLDIEPMHLDEALNFLVSKQHYEGHFGINWYYYASYYYLLRPTVAALMRFAGYPQVAAARDFVLARQRRDGSWFSRADGAGQTASTELHTALALGTLACAGVRADAPAVGRAVSWLLERRRADGSWCGGDYPYPKTDGYREFQAPQDIFTTAQVLVALRELESS
ncbi:prenyltransferase/squalene oxidase repeat-containing protein [Mycobacterium camsae]|uniref:prenyltransferase/squalene oxidase repeat-containing protein n=1 Tax=Mycobacterium gordonae TaxID=1778 RepID=UPI00197CD1D5|nr:prenyltransferase/squalene oxidase repeat-containing protein [Mycobacterium gordonae]